MNRIGRARLERTRGFNQDISNDGKGRDSFQAGHVAGVLRVVLES